MKRIKRVIVSLDEREHDWVASRADHDGLTMSATVRMLLRGLMLDEAEEMRALPAEQGRLDPA